MSRGPIPDKAADRPTVPEMVPRIDEYLRQPGNGNGGSLHIVLADYNVDDGHVEFCLDWAERHDDAEGAALAAELLRMTKTQRLRLGHRMTYP